MPELIVADKIYLIGWPDHARVALAKALTLPNPLYHLLMRKGNRRALYAVPKDFTYYQKQGDIMIVPRGCLEPIKTYAFDQGIEYKEEVRLSRLSLDKSFKSNHKFKWRDYQEGVIEKVLPHDLGVLKLDTGWGKCHGKGTKILMFDGSYKKVEDIIEGDYVMGDDSSKRTILNTVSGVGKLYKVTPISGKSFVCNGDHILSLKYTKCRKHDKGELINISIDDYLRTTKTFKHNVKLWRTAVEFPRRKTLLDPYFVGVWLGDGHSNGSTVSNPDYEIEDYMGEYAKEFGLKLVTAKDGNKCKTLRMSTQKSRKKIPITYYLDKYNLRHNKHIPDDFKINSRGNRLLLLAGLLDTDGYYYMKGFEIATKYKQLNDDIVFLCRSLGFRASSKLTTKRIKSTGFTGKYYVIKISGDCSVIPTKIKRKIAQPRLQKKDILVSGFKIKELGIGKYYGFNLDGNHLYLLEDFTVSHNSLLCLKLIEAKNLKTLIIVPRSSILNQFVGEARDFFDYQLGIIKGDTWEIKDITVASISTLQKRDLKDIKDQFGMVIVDEIQNYITPARLKVIQAFNPSVLYGMSATPDREDGQGKAIRFIFGPQLVDEQVLRAKPKVYCVPTNSGIALDEYTDMVSEQVKDSRRNALVANIINNEIATKRRILVLTKRIEHYKAIAELINPKAVVFPISSEIKESERMSLLHNLREGHQKFDVLLGTTSLLSTGLNIPMLDTLIIAGDLKSKILTNQSSGRILRILSNKKDPKIIDIYDNLNKVFYRQHLSRKHFYSSQGWEIIK